MNIKQIEKLKKSDSLLPFFHPKYKHPTPQEIDLVLKLTGLSQRQAALLTGVNSNEKGSPTIRRWKTDISLEQHRKIPYAAWRVLIEYAGLSSTKEVIEHFKKIEGIGKSPDI